MVVFVLGKVIINSIVSAEIKIVGSIANVSSRKGKSKHTISLHIFIFLDSEAECFPSDSIVDVLNVGPKRLSEVRVGSRVRVIDENNMIKYSPIIAFLHRDLNEHALYKQIRTKTAELHLSKRHLIERRNDGFVWAETLRVNDEILVVSSNKTAWEKIIEITELDKQGLMAPLTEQGTIIVNNVHASCYALVKYHSLGHIALAPFRWYHRVFGQISDLNSTPILNYANVLLEFFQNMPIAKDLIF